MKHDFYYNLKDLVFTVIGCLLGVFIYLKYRHRQDVPNELKYGTIFITLGCFSGAIHSYLLMYNLDNFCKIETIHYYDQTVFFLVLGGWLLLKGGQKYKDFAYKPERQVFLKKLKYWYIFLSLILIGVRLMS